jgi:hypothetical protein
VQAQALAFKVKTASDVVDQATDLVYELRRASLYANGDGVDEIEDMSSYVLQDGELSHSKVRSE